MTSAPATATRPMSNRFDGRLMGRGWLEVSEARVTITAENRQLAVGYTFLNAVETAWPPSGRSTSV
jgi:hypothetical protein